MNPQPPRITLASVLVIGVLAIATGAIFGATMAMNNSSRSRRR